MVLKCSKRKASVANIAPMLFELGNSTTNLCLYPMLYLLLFVTMTFQFTVVKE